MSQHLSGTVLGQCGVSQHLVKGFGTIRSVPTLEWKGLGTVRSVPTLEWKGLVTVRSVPTIEWEVLGQCEVSQHLSIRSWDSTRCPNTRSWDSVKCPNTRAKGLGTVRSVPTLEWEVLGQCEVSQHLSIRSWDSTRCPNTRSWDSVKCPNTRSKGLGTV